MPRNLKISEVLKKTRTFLLVCLCYVVFFVLNAGLVFSVRIALTLQGCFPRWKSVAVDNLSLFN